MYYKKDWLLFFVLMTLIFLAAGRTALDTDLWWHLRAGEETLARGFPLMVDRFSFTAQGTPWINHSWLAQVILFGVFKGLGFFGLGGVVALISTLCIAVMYFQMSGSAIFRAFIAILGTVTASVVMSPRPQIFSLLLVAVTQFILYQYKWKKVNHLGWLPVVFVLWSNLHGGYPLGLVLIGITFAGEIINRWLNPAGAMGWGEIRKLGWIGLICAAAVVVNPNGFNMWLIPFQTVEIKALQNLIEEWASPNFHELIQQSFLWLLFGLLVVFALNRKRVDAVDLLSVIVLGYMGFLARRNIAPFAIIATPILSRYAWALLEEKGENLGFLKEREGVYYQPWQKAVNLLLVAILAAAGIGKVYLVNHPVFIRQTLEQSMPVGAVEWVKNNRTAGNLLNEYNWGGFISWNLREHPIFIDGRTDLYGDKIISEWLTLVTAGNGYEKLLADYQIGFTILSPGQPIVNRLLERGWKAEYRDDISIVLIRPNLP